MDLHVFIIELIIALGVIWVNDNTIDWTHCDTSRFIVVANTLGAKVRINFVILLAIGYRLIWAFGVAHITVDAVVFNQ